MERLHGGRLRFVELDALRGIAAMIVVIFHFAMFAVVTGGVHSSLLFLIRPVLAGHAAVILFFVLSGFVLSLSTWRGTRIPYRDYLIRRVCRIYLPYLAALIFAVLGSIIYWHRAGSYSLGHGAWDQPPTLASVIRHVTLLGHYDFRFNQVYWSVVIEMRISIVFPIICLALQKVNKWVAGLTGVALSGAAIALEVLHPHGAMDSIRTAWLSTGHYLAFFLIGALLARRLCRRDWPSISNVVAGIMLLVSIALLAYSQSLVRLLGSVSTGAAELMIDWSESIGAVGLIYLAATQPRVKRTLAHFILRFLGHISYSLYLVHFVVLVGLMALLHGRVPMVAIFPIYVSLAIGLATVFNRFIEIPAIQIGRRFTTPGAVLDAAPLSQAQPVYETTR